MEQSIVEAYAERIALGIKHLNVLKLSANLKDLKDLRNAVKYDIKWMILR